MRSESLVLGLGTTRLVLVQPKVVEAILINIERPYGFREAGGILIGAHRGSHIEINDCTQPLPKDIRTRTGFYRRDPGHQASALAAWKASSGTDTFVGEWHTHPEDYPRYSFIDRVTWGTLMCRSREPVVLAIGGWREIWWGLGSEARIQRLTELTDEPSGLGCA
ncbi:MAG: Mov34/MPN/PAD-1 family protein [Fimbriimonadaceae bacterium]